MYDIETIYEAENVSHAVKLLEEHPEAQIIAGGSDMLIEIREGKKAGCTLVSIQKLEELRPILMCENGDLRIGALATFSQIAKDPVIHKHLPVLAEAAELVGGPQLRNIATIGGNVCNGVTSADSASTLMAYDAVMEYSGPKGVRLVPIEGHYVSAGKTSLAHDEILTAIIIPQKSHEGSFGHYIKYCPRNAMDIANLGCSVNVRLSGDKKTIETMRVSFGVAGPVPMRSKSAEKAASGKPVCIATIEEAAGAVTGDINPRTSWRATKEFRLHLALELVKRAALEAIKKAGGSI
jgi:xanthine dehydrogenase FAD-binding subunit